MSKTHALTVACILTATATTRAQAPGTYPLRADEMTVALSVVHALEEGPIVCTVTLQNVSKRRLMIGTPWFGDGAYCRIDAGWNARREPRFRLVGYSGALPVPREHHL